MLKMYFYKHLEDIDYSNAADNTENNFLDIWRSDLINSSEVRKNVNF